jgi:predicted phosphodiesterase
VQVWDRCLYVLHDVHQLHLDPEAAGMHVVVSGHSHRPACDRRGPVLYVNPGSAGPRRFRLPIAVGRLHLEHGELRFELVELAAEG